MHIGSEVRKRKEDSEMDIEYIGNVLNKGGKTGSISQPILPCLRQA